MDSSYHLSNDLVVLSYNQSTSEVFTSVNWVLFGSPDSSMDYFSRECHVSIPFSYRQKILRDSFLDGIATWFVVRFACTV